MRRALSGERCGTWEWDPALEQLSVRLLHHTDDDDDSAASPLSVCSVHPDDTRWFAARAREAVRGGWSSLELPIRLLEGNAGVSWFLATGRLPSGPSNQRAKLSGLVVEIRDTAALSTRASSIESFYGTVLDSLVEEVAIVDSRGEIIETNRAWTMGSGASFVTGQRLTIGTNYIEVLRAAAKKQPEARHVLAGITRVIAARGAPFRHDYRYTEGEREHWCAVKVCRLQRPEGGLVVIHSDVTDHRLAEREREAHSAELARAGRAAVLGQLSGAIAHELNQPLTAILANAQAGLEIMHGVETHDELREILSDIEHDTKRAGEVIKRVRGMLRLREANLEMLSLNQVVEDVLSFSRSDLVLRRVNVTKDLDPLLPALRGDVVQLQQLMLNLIVNACDAMQSLEGPQLVVRTSTTPAGGSRVAVSDRGPGFACSERDKLLQPFFTTKDHGLGLGLTICQSIVRAHGGVLQLANRESGGACVMVDFPPAASGADAEGPAPAADQGRSDSKRWPFAQRSNVAPR
ncbi:MAG TPA: ATP-binding protein [Gammaproteobacteria bacterium]|nr:ATP-binding protein [Gammaproteobacteria bacterium]